MLILFLKFIKKKSEIFMLKNIKTIFSITSAIVLGSVFLLNCEPEADNLGEQFFTSIKGNETQYDLTAFNISNNDSIKSDHSNLVTVPLGAFDEGNFGMQKASYVTQLRMSSYSPTFGTNAVVDSVVLVLNPIYSSDSVTTKTDENFIYSEGNVAAKKVINSYPVKKYGKAKISGVVPTFNINVHEVTDFLGGTTDTFYSNKIVNYSTLLGTKVFDGNVYSSSITKDSDSSVLFSNDTSLRINLNAGFFQNKIIDKEGSLELSDVAGFIRHFKGIRISVQENDGYIMNIAPSAGEIVMYYKYDKVDNGTTTRPQTTFKFVLGSGNVRIGQYEYNRTGTPVAAIPSTPNSSTGDAKLFAQGMGGPSVGVKIPESTIAELKSKFNNEKIAVIDAKIRIYTDEATWSNKYAKPETFTILEENATSFLVDMTTLLTAPNFNLVRAYNLEQQPSHYDFTITNSLKEIIEKNANNKTFVVNIGNFLLDTNSQYLGFYKTSRAYTPHRVVLVGSDVNNSKKIQLNVTFGSK